MKQWIPAVAAVILTAMPVTASAKTANWSVEPVYSSMEAIGPGAYKVQRGIYTGVIDGSGKEIIKMSTDSITPFVGGQALVLTPSGDGTYRLQQILHADLTSTPVYEEVWVEDYPFFSEGLLPVRNKQGFYGYMDESGRMVLKPSYLNIHPFHEGLAAVVKRPSNLILQLFSKAADKVMELIKQKTTVTYINRGGAEVKMQKNIGKLVNASTFNNGVAFVENKDGRQFLVNTQGALVRSMSVADPQYDDRYIYVDDDYDNHILDEDLTAIKEMDVDRSVKTFREGNLYGYTSQGQVVLPAQFEDADLFSEGYAMACLNGKWGILKLDEGSFTCQAPEAAKATKRGKRTKAAASGTAKNFVVTTPAAFESTALTLTVGASGGYKATETVAGDGGKSRVFPLTRPSGDFTMTLSSKDLVLWRGSSATATQNVTSSDRIRISISPSSAKADIKDNAVVTVTFTNPGDEAVTTLVRVSGVGLTPVSRTITIPANKSRRISTTFTKVYKRESRWVSASAGDFKAGKNISVTPYYVKF